MSKHIVLNTLLLGFVFVFTINISQAQSNEELAKELFADANFAEALPHFEELYKLYPHDAWIQYYYGVCLTETQQFSMNTRKILLQSAQENVPGNVFFYIAKNYHALNQFDTAAQYYERFDDYARNREKRKLDFKTYYEACINNENPFEIAPIQEKAGTQTENISNQQKTDKQNDGEKYVKEEQPQTAEATKALAEEKSEQTEDVSRELAEVKQVEIPEELHDSIINFNVISDITYRKFSQFKTNAGKYAFANGISLNKQLESAIHKTNSLRNQYKNETDESRKNEIAQNVIALELESIKLKSNADNAFNEARKHEINFWKDAPREAIREIMQENDSIAASLLSENEFPLSEEIEAAEMANTLQTDTLITETEQTDLPAGVNDESEKVETTNTEETLEETKDNIRYKVQIGAYSKGLPEYIDRLYKKLSVLRRIENYTDDRGIVVYTIGYVDNFEDAVKLQNQIRQEGVKDAFVVAYNNGKRITLSEAREIQKND
ncbi:MAG: SPOR domain-containing protein [Prolixibacteraceae bacterium]|jgi:hypothetical protein|nr:SPOR domain-containing protein [Prolixibacteraceae bacterium]